MATPNPLRDPQFEFKALLVLVLAATVLFALIVWPFFGAVCWAVFIAIVFWPLHQRFLKGSRGKPNVAALASLTVILLIVILPLAMLAASITQEASVLVAKMKNGEIQIVPIFQTFMAALPAWVHSILDRFGVGNLGLLQQKLFAALANSGEMLTSRALDFGQGTLDFLVSFFLM